MLLAFLAAREKIFFVGVTVGVDRSQLQMNTRHNHQANTRKTTNQLLKPSNTYCHAGSGKTLTKPGHSFEEHKQSLNRWFTRLYKFSQPKTSEGGRDFPEINHSQRVDYRTCINF